MQGKEVSKKKPHSLSTHSKKSIHNAFKAGFSMKGRLYWGLRDLFSSEKLFEFSLLKPPSISKEKGAKFFVENFPKQKKWKQNSQNKYFSISLFDSFLKKRVSQTRRTCRLPKKSDKVGKIGTLEKSFWNYDLKNYFYLSPFESAHTDYNFLLLLHFLKLYWWN